MSALKNQKPQWPSKCPVVLAEFQRIRESHAVLASTGCTKEFCQAGRVIHTDEPRVGENRALCDVEQEAEKFLRELHQEGFFATVEGFKERLDAVRLEIRTGTLKGFVRKDKQYAEIGGNWVQTTQELEFGLRRAWRNSRKCIMRSHCEELKLYDLRSVTRSEDMAKELIRGLSKAFNDGNIEPTVFVFPPRTANCRGPMIWNNQVLGFAGYEADGVVIGDPINVELTKEIMELGWEPPKHKGRWDLLPLVTMADGDVPVITELPLNLRKLVQIRHPRYETAFDDLGLKWVPFPALTRLGFDIGGVQYTAAPFIGWFMDSEIGVRNLADTFRYNVLPDIVNALGLAQDKLGDGIESFRDLPEYEQLFMLSRAQSELNYAVQWSFNQTRVSMTDTLTASTKWMRYDDEFKKVNGFRLPSDPYWLAPPQGSIIPLWHRGGAPCYQPKPMICKHVEDPVKAWRREIRGRSFATKIVRSVAVLCEQNSQTRHTVLGPLATAYNGFQESLRGIPQSRMDSVDGTGWTQQLIRPRLEKSVAGRVDGVECNIELGKKSIALFFCSGGTIAERLAAKLHDRISKVVKGSPNAVLCPEIQPLNALEPSKITADRVFLLIVSSTGQGLIPANGSSFPKTCTAFVSKSQSQSVKGFKFAIFGNGDSRYASSYNTAAIKIYDRMIELGGSPLASGLFWGDTAVESPPLKAFSFWWNELQPIIHLLSTGTKLLNKQQPRSLNGRPKLSGGRSYGGFQKRGEELHQNFKDAVLIATSPPAQRNYDGTLRVTIDIGRATYKEMSCIQILPVNSPSKVRRAIQALGVSDSAQVEHPSFPAEHNLTYKTLLTEFVDLEVPFLGFAWLEQIEGATAKGLTSKTLGHISVLHVLERLLDANAFTGPETNKDLQYDICLAMPILHVRTYSIASSFHFLSINKPTSDSGEEKPRNQVDILVKAYQGGRFSETSLNDWKKMAALKVRFVDSTASDRIRKVSQDLLVPLIVVATGAGFGPVRCLLQRRIAAIQDAASTGLPPPVQRSNISLFLGFRPNDVDLATDVLDQAAGLDLIDMLFIIPSNEAKVRAHDKIQTSGVSQQLTEKLLDQSGVVFVCTSQAAAHATASAFDSLVGGNVREVLGDRYLEEVF